MPAQVSEAFTLRTYPLREADLIVSFFTRDQGKLRGVARKARSSQSRFGSGIERLSQVTMYYFQRENRELVTLDRCELIHSQFSLAGDYAASIALDYIAEISEHLLPAGEPNERYFRLLAAVLDYLRRCPEAGLWPSVNYFLLWAVRLSGLLPELRLNAESAAIAEEMLVTPIARLTSRAWSRQTAVDLRRLLVRQIEQHVERRLLTPAHLESL
jgi:DNA repair protein RecO (recombination protein O)